MEENSETKSQNDELEHIRDWKYIIKNWDFILKNSDIIRFPDSVWGCHLLFDLHENKDVSTGNNYNRKYRRK